ncbi:hypothetical protein EDB84DRAFT_710250 [Lactarius hengduanensis]|nr:hypothetical protein EDB84DRAFT_710250 [Lactarius hengduanensis]
MGSMVAAARAWAGIVGGVERGRLGMNKGPAPARVTNRGQTSTCTVYLNLTSVCLLLVVFCTILSRSVSLLLLSHRLYIYRHRLPVCLSVRHSFSLESRNSVIYPYRNRQHASTGLREYGGYQVFLWSLCMKNHGILEKKLGELESLIASCGISWGQTRPDLALAFTSAPIIAVQYEHRLLVIRVNPTKPVQGCSSRAGLHVCARTMFEKKLRGVDLLL